MGTQPTSDRLDQPTYQNIHGQEQWSQLPDNPHEYCGLAVIDGLLTSVGGSIPTLFSVSQKKVRGSRSSLLCPHHVIHQLVSLLVVVAGGYASRHLATVEVMNISTKQWTTVSPLPQKQSGIVCGDTLYLAGGFTGAPSKSVFACSLPDLLTSSNSLGSRIRRTFSQRQNIWNENQ